MAAWMAFIESNTSGTGRLFARAARELGLRPILFCSEPARYPYAVEDGLDTLQIDTADEAAMLQACQRLGREPGLAGIWSSSEYYIATAASLSRRLGLPGPPPESIQACRDKQHQRERLRQAGLNAPVFRSVDSPEAAAQAAQAMGFPAIVKPVSGSGSVGVLRCGSPGEVARHAEQLLAQRFNERGQPIPNRILVESEIIGPEYSVETFNKTVIGITRKHLGQPPTFVEVGHDFPFELPRADATAIHDTVLRALEVLGLGWGPAHTELRLTSAGPTIIEVNPRLAGGFIPELVRHALGLDQIARTVEMATGQTPDLRTTRQRHASIRFILPPGDGILATVEGLEAAQRMPEVIEARLYTQPGSQVRLRGDFRDRIGHILTCADTSAAASEAAQHALGTIRLTLR